MQHQMKRGRQMEALITWAQAEQIGGVGSKDHSGGRGDVVDGG